MVPEPKSVSLLPPNSEAETPLQTDAAKTTELPLPLIPSQRASSWEDQDFGVSHPASGYLLLKLSSGRVESGGADSFLLSH